MWWSPNPVRLSAILCVAAEGLDQFVPSLSITARNLTYWYGKICESPAGCFATAPKQARHSGRRHGLSRKHASIFITPTD